MEAQLIRRSLFIGLAMLLATLPAAWAGAPNPADIDRGTTGAAAFLLSRLGDNGVCVDEYPPDNPRFGGKTALTAYALLCAKADPQRTPRLAAALEWLADAPLDGVYPVAMRTQAFCRLPLKAVRTRLEQDARWLIDAAGPDGGYAYEPTDHSDAVDNSNTHLAGLAVWATARRGITVPDAYWRALAGHWLNQQQPDGGWGYRTFIRDGKAVAKPYGSMTAAGVASLAACHDQLAQADHARDDALLSRRLQTGLAWLAEHYSPQFNPRKGVEHYHYWLFALQRACRATGQKYLGQADWYQAAAASLLDTQREDGSWGLGDRVEPTAFALLFLLQGRSPILVAKLQYPGDWNPYPRDTSHLTAYLGRIFERDLGWVVVQPDPRLADLEDGRILYLTGRGPIEFSDEQLDAMRQFVWRGGVILSVAVDNDAAFTLAMHRHYQRLFPHYPFTRPPERHPVMHLHFRNAPSPGLRWVHNGVRPLAIHIGKDIAADLQAGPDELQNPTFQAMANLYVYLTDRGAPDPRGEAHWPEISPTRPARHTLRLARLKYKGNWNPEPAADRRLGEILASQGLSLSAVTAIGFDELDATRYPLVHLTGTEALNLSATQQQQLSDYLHAGGTVIADAAGGAKAFDESMRTLMRPFGEIVLLPSYADAINAGPFALDDIRYRPGTAAVMMPDQQRQLRLEAVYIGNRPAIIYSRDDLTAGLIGYPLYGLDGYQPTSCRKIMANLVRALGRVKPQGTATDQSPD